MDAAPAERGDATTAPADARTDAATTDDATTTPADAGTDAAPTDTGDAATPPADAAREAGADAGGCGVCDPGRVCDGLRHARAGGQQDPR